MTLTLLALLFPLAIGINGQHRETPLNIQRTTDLRFGSFITGSTPGTVTISPTGMRTATGGVTLLPTEPGRPATFVIRGKPYAPYLLDLPPEVSIHQDGHELRIDQFKPHPDRGILSGEFPQGRQIVQVGATLHVKPNQRSGAYQFRFEVGVRPAD